MQTELIIADDHPVFRQGLKKLLTDEADFSIVGEAGTGTEALGLICDLKPVVAVLDISMPGMGGLEVAAEVKRKNLKTRCIMLSVHDDAEIVKTAIRSGAFGYLLKTNTFDEIVRAVRIVAGGGKFISSQIAGVLAEEPLRHSRTQLLTDREREILKLVVQGLSAKEVADSLGISYRTVHTHKSHIMSKLGVSSTPAMMSYAIKNRIISDA